MAGGTTQQFIATGTFNNNGTISYQQLDSVVWNSSNPAAVTITNDLTNPGVAYAAGTTGQQTTITACAGPICSTGFTVTVQ